MTRPSLTEQKKQARMAYFIQCTRELIEEEGYSEVSIRKIAEKAGFHNSTIYFYFNDVEYLLALASVRSFEKYSSELAEIGSLSQSSAEVFYPVWECFCRNAFADPELFYGFFFGKYKDQITDILNTYYELFPEEKKTHLDIIQEMFFAGNLTDRCLAILRPLQQAPGFRVTTENIDTLNYLSIVAFRDLLHQKCQDPSLSAEALTDKYLSILHFLIDAD